MKEMIVLVYTLELLEKNKIVTASDVHAKITEAFPTLNISNHETTLLMLDFILKKRIPKLKAENINDDTQFLIEEEAKQVKIIKVSRTEIVDIIKNNGGKYGSVNFVTIDGRDRLMNVKLVARDGMMTNLGYIKMYDLEEKTIKNVNSRTIKAFTVNKTKYIAQ